MPWVLFIHPLHSRSSWFLALHHCRSLRITSFHSKTNISDNKLSYIKMQNFALFTCLLVSLVAANPVEVGRRSFVSGGAMSQSQSHSESSSTTGGGFGGGVIGNSFGNTGFSRFSSSSSTMYQYLQDFSSNCASVNGMILSGSFGGSAAMQTMQSLAYSFQKMLTEATSCGCVGQEQLGMFGSSFSQFHSVMSNMQRSFGGSISQFANMFQSVSPVFQSFCQTYANQMDFSTVFPAGISSTLRMLGITVPHALGFK